jgi:D-threonate/D-erythronate kinase
MPVEWKRFAVEPTVEPRINLLIMADDLTGALDVGVRFASRGIPTQVLPSMKELDQVGAGIATLVVNTESRHLTAADAAWTAGWLADWSLKQRIPYIYKKTDSALRGNVGPEIKAVIDICGLPAMFVPAFPEAGRTTLGGRQYIDGIPLEQSESGRDPFNPVKTSDIAKIIAANADIRVRNVPLSDPWPPMDQPDLVYIFDGATESDLSRIAGRLMKSGLLGLSAGCAGFAAHLADVLPLPRGSLVVPELSPKILTVCGSVHEKNLRQLKSAENLGYFRVVLSGGQLIDDDYWRAPAGQQLIRQYAAALEKQGRLLVHVDAFDGLRMPKDTAESAQLPNKAAANLGFLTSSILGMAGRCTLVVFGGDTARSIFSSIAATDIRPVHEVEAGVALSRIGSRYGQMSLISKGGGLGSDGVLESIDRYVRGRASR